MPQRLSLKIPLLLALLITHGCERSNTPPSATGTSPAPLKSTLPPATIGQSSLTGVWWDAERRSWKVVERATADGKKNLLLQMTVAADVRGSFDIAPVYGPLQDGIFQCRPPQHAIIMNSMAPPPTVYHVDGRDPSLLVVYAGSDQGAAGWTFPPTAHAQAWDRASAEPFDLVRDPEILTPAGGPIAREQDLSVQIKSRQWQARANALRALHQLTPNTAVPLAAAALDDEITLNRLLAVDALGRTQDAAAVDPLALCLAGVHGYAAAARAQTALGKMNPRLAPYLLAWVSDSAKRLAQFDQSDKAAREVQYSALRPLLAMGEQSLPAVGETLAASSEYVAYLLLQNVVRPIGGPKAAQVAAAYLANHPADTPTNGTAIMEAVQILAAFADPDTVAILARYCGTYNVDAALVKIGAPKAGPVLLAALGPALQELPEVVRSSPHSQYEGTAGRYRNPLRAMDKIDAAWLSEAYPKLPSGDTRVALAQVYYGRPERTGFLETVLADSRDKFSPQRLTSVEGLQKANNDKALFRLIDMLNDDDGISEAAARAMDAYRDPRIIAPLLHRLETLQDRPDRPLLHVAIRPNPYDLMFPLRHLRPQDAIPPMIATLRKVASSSGSKSSAVIMNLENVLKSAGLVPPQFRSPADVFTWWESQGQKWLQSLN